MNREYSKKFFLLLSMLLMLQTPNTFGVTGNDVGDGEGMNRKRVIEGDNDDDSSSSTDSSIYAHCSHINEKKYAYEYRLCLNSTTVNHFDVDEYCIDCLSAPKNNSNAGDWLWPLAYFGSNLAGAYYNYKGQKGWANAYQAGFDACTTQLRDFQKYSELRGSNAILAREQSDMMDSCNGHAFSQFAGGGGHWGTGFPGGGGNPWINAGWTPGMMQGMIGPYGMQGPHGQWGNGTGIHGSIHTNGALGALLGGLFSPGGIHAGINVNGHIGPGGPWSMGPGANGPWSMGPGANGHWSMGPGAHGPWSMGPGANGHWSMGPGSNGPWSMGPGGIHGSVHASLNNPFAGHWSMNGNLNGHMGPMFPHGPNAGMNGHLGPWSGASGNTVMGPHSWNMGPSGSYWNNGGSWANQNYWQQQQQAMSQAYTQAQERYAFANDRGMANYSANRGAANSLYQNYALAGQHYRQGVSSMYGAGAHYNGSMSGYWGNTPHSAGNLGFNFSAGLYAGAYAGMR